MSATDLSVVPAGCVWVPPFLASGRGFKLRHVVRTRHTSTELAREHQLADVERLSSRCYDDVPQFLLGPDRRFPDA